MSQPLAMSSKRDLWIRIRCGVARIACALLCAIAGSSMAVATARAASAPVSVFPIPGSRLATPQTQITFRGMPASQLGTITVTGSASGAHTGQVESDSDGQGGSFLPSAPFIAGEQVTVQTDLNVIGGQNGTFSFTIENPGGAIPPPGQRTVAPRVRGDELSFRSRPDLHPAAVKITQGRPLGNDIFLTPMRGPVQWGPMIVDPAGHPVWFDPLPGPEEEAADLRVQQYQGQPVLTWWEGFQNAGMGQGNDVIFDQHYHQIAVVRAGNGLNADLHAFTITPQDTALITSYHLVHWNASSIGGPRNQGVFDCTIQEIDIPTGLVLFQWDSLDQIPLSDSYSHYRGSGHPYDYFHVNSVQQDQAGNLIVSARNTWAVYDIDHRTGRVIWTLGGKHSSFHMGSGTSTAFQHHARLYQNGQMTIFDDGAAPQVHPQSRGLIEQLDTTHMSVTKVRALDHHPALVSAYEGSLQLLAHGNAFVGWGSEPYFTEFGTNGAQIFDGRFVDANSSYRAYRFAWNGQPQTQPALSVSAGGAGIVHLYASWNGATGVSGWRVLAGAGPSSLAPIGTSRRTGFETAIAATSGDRYFAVQALDGGGHTLATSQTESVSSHIAIFGKSAFVSGGGVGGLPAACYAPSPCHVTTTLKVGRTTVARTGQESLSSSGGILYFKLTDTGHRMLMQSPHQRLRVSVSAQAGSGIGGMTTLTLIPFHTSGGAPHRSVSQAQTLRFMGLTDFVYAGRTGGILAACLTTTPCHVSTTVSVGRTVIAHTGPELLGSRETGYLMFTLRSQGRQLLAAARGNQLPVTVTISGDGQTARAQIALVPFS